MRTQLTATFDSRKSFYGKAEIETVKNGLELYSYNTLVAQIIKGELTILNTQSATTLRHIKEFMLQNGMQVDTKQNLIKKYGV